MFRIFSRFRIKRYTEEAATYVKKNYEAPAQPTKIHYSLDVNLTKKEEPTIYYSDRDVQYSRRGVAENKIKYSVKNKEISKDPYDANEVTTLLRNSTKVDDFTEMIEMLERNINQTFVERMLYYIDKKGVKDSEVYKAAQVDKRLYSKMISNMEYKPSKDTAISIALALELSLDEANDLLSRAGYTFSHSNKRDIIIEFFFRENIYNLIDLNDVLHRLDQKVIGRF